MQNEISGRDLSTRDPKGKDRMASLFLILVLVSGLMIAFLTPPMCSPDENAHYLNAYAISRGEILPQLIDSIPGRYVEGRALDFVGKYTGKFYGNITEKYAFTDQYYDSYLEDANTDLVFYASTLNTINPVSYVVASLSMVVGRTLGSFIAPSLSTLPYNQLLYGRIGNLLFYLFVTYIALRRTPCFKRLMFVLAVMPIVLYLGASVNYDAIMLAVTFLYISEVCKLLLEPKDKILTKGDLFIVLFCTFFLVGCKMVYATLLLMLLAVPKQRYGSTKRMIGCIVAVFAVGIIAYLPVFIINRICSGMANTSTPYVIEQTEYVKAHLTEMPHIFLHTIRMLWFYYLNSFWGSLGQLDTNIPFAFTVLFYGILLFLCVIEINTTNLWDRHWKRLLPFGAVFISLIGIFGVMYLTWTPLPGIAEGVGSSYISGVQGRYLIQLFIPAVSVFCFGRLSKYKLMNRLVALTDSLSCGWAIASCVITVLVVFIRFW